MSIASQNFSSGALSVKSDGFHRVGLFLIWLSATTIAVFFALIIKDSTVLGDLYIPRTNDSFYHARRILDAALGDAGLYQFEERINPPDGIWVPWPWGYDYLMAKLLQLTLWIRPGTDAMAVLAYVPVAWIGINAGLFLACASALGLSMQMRLLAMVAFALSPLTQLLHGIAMIDHHFVEHTFVLLTIWLGLDWMKRPAARGPAIGLGIALGTALAFHNGLFLLQLIPLCTLGLLWVRGQLPSYTTVLSFALALFLTTLASVLPSEPFQAGMFAFGYLSWFHFYVSLCTSSIIVLMGWRPYSRRQAAVLSIVAAVLAIPMLAQFGLGATFLSGGISVLQHITEAQSPLRLFTETMGPTETASYYSWLLLLTPVVLAFGVYSFVTSAGPVRIYFAAASVLGIGLMLTQFRFYYMGMFALIAGVFLIVDLVRERRGWHHGMTFVIAFGLLVLAYQPSLRQRLFTVYAIAADPEYQSAISIFFKLESACAENPGLVLANNDDGNAILFHSDCSVIANNFFLDSEDQARVDEITRLMKSSPGELLAAEPRISYLFIRRDDFSHESDGGRLELDMDSQIIAEVFAADQLPAGFELISSVYAMPAPDADLVTHARLYRLTRPATGN